MTKRAILFKSRAGWYVSPEFIGDKTELAHSSLSYRCDKDWPEIMKQVSRAKTLDEFRRACHWARSFYHSDIQRPIDSEELRLYPVTAMPDELLVVYEDLAATGIRTLVQCIGCGLSYQLTFKPDGTAEIPGKTCISCGGRLRSIDGPLPSAVRWKEAIEKCRSNACFKVGEERVKIRKLIKYEERAFLFEVKFADGHTAVLPDTELKYGEVTGPAKI